METKDIIRLFLIPSPLLAAFNEALKTAIIRGDTNSIDYIKNCPVIEIFE